MYMCMKELCALLALSKRLSLNHLMTLSASYENQYLIPDYVTASRIRRLSYDYMRISYNYQANTLDQKHFPNKGITYGVSLASLKLVGAAVRILSVKHSYKPGDEESPFSFDRTYGARAWFNTYTSPSEKVTVNIGGDLLLITGTDSITKGNDFWLLGGMDALTDRSIAAIGFHPNQIMIKNIGGVRFGTDIEIASDLHLTFEGNLFALTESEREIGFTIMGGYGISAGYMTVAGPMRIGIMQGFYDRQLLFKNIKGFVSMGFTF